MINSLCKRILCDWERLWHVLLTLEHWWHWWGMRYGGRETSVIESPWHRSCYKRCNRAFPVWGTFSWRAEKLLASRLPIVTNTSKWSERSHGKKDTTFIILFYFVYKYIINQGRISIGYSCWPCDSIMGKVMKLWIYENHICELRSEELNEGRSSQVI